MNKMKHILLLFDIFMESNAFSSFIAQSFAFNRDKNISLLDLRSN